MGRTDAASRVIDASPERIYAALTDPAALAVWLPPTTADADVVEARFIELVPGARVVQAIEFESDDPDFAGTMLMTWSLEHLDTGTLVTFRAEDVPPGISAADHAAGFAASLANLARLVS